MKPVEKINLILNEISTVLLVSGDDYLRYMYLKALWNVVDAIITSLSYDDISQEEFNQIKTNCNIVAIEYNDQIRAIHDYHNWPIEKADLRTEL